MYYVISIILCISGEGPEEDPERMGRGLRRLPREVRLHQADRGAEAKACSH